MNRYPRSGRSKATASTLCQKCLKRDTYECKASVQERPYAARPSRTQQLFNPALAPKLSSDAPPGDDDDLLRKKGVADAQLKKAADERRRDHDGDVKLDSDSDLGEGYGRDDEHAKRHRRRADSIASTRSSSSSSRTSNSPIPPRPTSPHFLPQTPPSLLLLFVLNVLFPFPGPQYPPPSRLPQPRPARPPPHALRLRRLVRAPHGTARRRRSARETRDAQPEQERHTRTARAGKAAPEQRHQQHVRVHVVRRERPRSGQGWEEREERHGDEPRRWFRWQRQRIS
ncbi:hypothetical protein BDY21DRAFT_360627 [Lineolata rhizophorae]|uniref:Uncharacterized protein n=1 Tax=Lineolata rhizophorae TaxID=578093 RepID=A0A6A6PCL2_9PEZI|nr:hypothetical protein BDY21DRAFT_360627 [Lineolata rhizophorae]